MGVQRTAFRQRLPYRRFDRFDISKNFVIPEAQNPETGCLDACVANSVQKL